MTSTRTRATLATPTAKVMAPEVIPTTVTAIIIITIITVTMKSLEDGGRAVKTN